MLNFRKLKQDFSSAILKEGKQLHEGSKVVQAKVIRLDHESIRFNGKILGNYENTYESEIEIDRFESETIHSNCDCPYRYDCQHLAALIFYLEEKIDSLIVQYSKEKDISTDSNIDQTQKQELLKTIKQAETKEEKKQDEMAQRQLLQEYINAAKVLSSSPFFLSEEKQIVPNVELALIFNPKSIASPKKGKVEFQIALRLPFRTKPLQISQVRSFFEALRFASSVSMGGKKYIFSMNSFDPIAQGILNTIMHQSHWVESSERAQKSAFISWETFGSLLADVQKLAEKHASPRGFSNAEELPFLPCVYYGNLETPLRYSPKPASLRFVMEAIDSPALKWFLKPLIMVEKHAISLEEAVLFACVNPGMLYQEAYYPFPPHIGREHLMHLGVIRDMTIPEPLFGTFVENTLPELKKYGEVTHLKALENIATLPFAGKLEAKCKLTYLDGELEAQLWFSYDKHAIPAFASQLKYEDIMSFVSEGGILARNLVEERQIIEALFSDFVWNTQQGTFTAKTEKKIVEFMTEMVPKYQQVVHFDCPQNLMDQFLYEESDFSLFLDACERVGYYRLKLKVNGALKGVRLDLLWDCISSKRCFIELDAARGKKQKEDSSKFSKILVLDLEKTAKIVSLFDELGITKLDNHEEDRPLWSLVSIDEQAYQQLPVQFSFSESLKEIRKQILGEKQLTPSPIPKAIQATLRPYQEEGVQWIERLRMMYLNGILADDMGLGKTLQAISAITQAKERHSKAISLIVCPTSLLYNWKEELGKFNPKLKTMVIDGAPPLRKKAISQLDTYAVVITSYTLLQKDIDLYTDYYFTYVILDEAQHIKNRGTRNAKSVKMMKATHKLILTGTPIENSLDEMWSLFDFLMPGFLSTFDRFVEKYIRVSKEKYPEMMEFLKRKVSPFILRRMKADVLKDLPAVSEITYHCQLSETQQELYRSYAESARDELTKLVERDGFDKVQIHVLATLTRLKQICCHPAIFAKEKAEPGDSSKYDMLLELLQTLVEGGHKTVIFSQYTRMLQIMREDFEQRGIFFCYLDGSSKNRLEIVKKFNEDEKIPVFLVSLKAGGTGLNLVGADTVIHYDMWWNPAVENQATDRVHRLGQKKSVSSYKLVALNTIEEKIVEMQKRKKGLVKKVVSCDDEAISKLTWADVLELLQT